GATPVIATSKTPPAAVRIPPNPRDPAARALWRRRPGAAHDSSGPAPPTSRTDRPPGTTGRTAPPGRPRGNRISPRGIRPGAKIRLKARCPARTGAIRLSILPGGEEVPPTQPAGRSSDGEPP